MHSHIDKKRKINCPCKKCNGALKYATTVDRHCQEERFQTYIDASGPSNEILAEGKKIISYNT